MECPIFLIIVGMLSFLLIFSFYQFGFSLMGSFVNVIIIIIIVVVVICKSVHFVRGWGQLGLIGCNR